MKSFSILAFGLICLGAGHSGLRAADGAIRLPPFEVSGVRPWLYAALPGYEVLSLEDEKGTRRIVEEIQRFDRFLPIFLTADAPQPDAAPSAMFLDRYSRSGVLTKAQEELGTRFKVGAYTAISEGQAFQFISPEVVASWRNGEVSPAGARFHGAAVLARPALAVWYLDGVSGELQRATFSERNLVLAARRWFERDLIPIDEMLNLTTQAQAIAWAQGSLQARQRYLVTAAWFVRWGLVADGGKYRTGLLALAASRQPVTDATFRQLFGLTLAEQERALILFGRRASGLTDNIRLPDALARVPLSPVEVRPAFEVEVARIVGGAYVALAAEEADPERRDLYHGIARQNLASVGLDQDPRFRAALKRLESLEKAGRRPAPSTESVPAK